MMKRNLFLAPAIIAAVALGGVLKADDTGTAATSVSPSAAMADTATAAVTTNDAPGSLKAGKDLLDQGKYDDAVTYFLGIGEQVAANGKAKREPYRQLDLATAYLGLGKYAEAEDAASKSIALDKDLEAAWNDLASAQVNDGKRADAMDTYTKGIAQLTTDNVDFSRLSANLAALQAAAGITPTPAPTAVPAAVSPSAATASTGTAQ
jgi:tetratricopeptide (TPR) repeat protein